MTVTHLIHAVVGTPLYVRYTAAGICAFLLIWAAFHLSAKVRAENEARSQLSLAAFQFVKRSLLAQYPGRVKADDIVATEVLQYGPQNNWSITGTVVITTYEVGQQSESAFNAEVEATCTYYGQDVCWRLLKLYVAETATKPRKTVHSGSTGHSALTNLQRAQNQLIPTTAELQTRLGSNRVERAQLRYDLAFLRSDPKVTELGVLGLPFQNVEGFVTPPPIPRQKPLALRTGMIH